MKPRHCVLLMSCARHNDLASTRLMEVWIDGTGRPTPPAQYRVKFPLFLNSSPTLALYRPCRGFDRPTPRKQVIAHVWAQQAARMMSPLNTSEDIASDCGAKRTAGIAYIEIGRASALRLISAEERHFRVS